MLRVYIDWLVICLGTAAFTWVIGLITSVLSGRDGGAKKEGKNKRQFKCL